MTGQEALDFSLAQCNTSQQALDTNTDAYAAWALRTVNFVAEDLYYYLQARLSSEERAVDIATHDLPAFDEADYPQGSTDVLILQPEQKILRIYVKYSDDGQYIKAQKISLNSFGVTPERLAENATQVSPLYTIIDRKLQVFPKSKQTITGGILVHQQRPYTAMTSLDDPFVDIPGDFQRTMIPHLQSFIYQRLRRYSDMEEVKKGYKSEREEMITEIAGRGGDRAKTVFRMPVYL